MDEEWVKRRFTAVEDNVAGVYEIAKSQFEALSVLFLDVNQDRKIEREILDGIFRMQLTHSLQLHALETIQSIDFTASFFFRGLMLDPAATHTFHSHTTDVKSSIHHAISVAVSTILTGSQNDLPKIKTSYEECFKLIDHYSREWTRALPRPEK